MKVGSILLELKHTREVNEKHHLYRSRATSYCRPSAGYRYGRQWYLNLICDLFFFAYNKIADPVNSKSELLYTDMWLIFIFHLQTARLASVYVATAGWLRPQHAPPANGTVR